MTDTPTFFDINHFGYKNYFDKRSSLYKSEEQRARERRQADALLASAKLGNVQNIIDLIQQPDWPKDYTPEHVMTNFVSSHVFWTKGEHVPVLGIEKVGYIMPDQVEKRVDHFVSLLTEPDERVPLVAKIAGTDAFMGRVKSILAKTDPAMDSYAILQDAKTRVLEQQQLFLQAAPDFNKIDCGIDVDLSDPAQVELYAKRIDWSTPTALGTLKYKMLQGIFKQIINPPKDYTNVRRHEEARPNAKTLICLAKAAGHIEGQLARLAQPVPMPKDTQSIYTEVANIVTNERRSTPADRVAVWQDMLDGINATSLKRFTDAVGQYRVLQSAMPLQSDIAATSPNTIVGLLNTLQTAKENTFSETAAASDDVKKDRLNSLSQIEAPILAGILSAPKTAQALLDGLSLNKPPGKHVLAINTVGLEKAQTLRNHLSEVEQYKLDKMVVQSTVRMMSIQIQNGIRTDDVENGFKSYYAAIETYPQRADMKQLLVDVAEDRRQASIALRLMNGGREKYKAQAGTFDRFAANMGDAFRGGQNDKYRTKLKEKGAVPFRV